MVLWAVVPAKPYAESKTRLSSVLSTEERIALARSMLRRTLGVIGRIPEIQETLVVSPDPAALAEGKAFGARTLQETGRNGLNDALRQASEVAVRELASAVLVLPTDLLLLAPEDLRALVALASPAPVVVVAPDRFASGTNALLVGPPALIQYQFGPSSFPLHAARARAAGARLEIWETPGLGLDVDGPEDLRLALESQRQTARNPKE